MAQKTISYLLSGGIFLISLSTVLLAQDVAPTPKQVVTPFGLRNAENVHLIPPDNDLITMSDGHIRMQNRLTGHYIDYPKPEEMPIAPFTDNGWITYASWLNRSGSPVSSFTTNWTVPSTPTTVSKQVLFQFNSIEPTSGTAILQPVLQFGVSAAGGGKYWAVASWYVVGTQAYYSSLVPVSVGQSLTGVIKLTSRLRTKFTYSCSFTGISGTDFSISKIPQLTWCTETLEVYSVTECSEFPNTAFSQMSGINVRTKAGTPSVTWGVTNAQTSCNVQTTIITQGATDAAVNIYY
jgi:hypothetical protein